MHVYIHKIYKNINVLPCTVLPVLFKTVGIRKSCMNARLPWLAVSSRSKATMTTENSVVHLPWWSARPEYTFRYGHFNKVECL